MGWATLVMAIIEFLLPILREWLERVLKDGGKALRDSPEGMSDADAVRAVFVAARAQTWWFQFGRRAVLALCERSCVNHAEELVTSARLNVIPPPLPPEDADAISKAMGGV